MTPFLSDPTPDPVNRRWQARAAELARAEQARAGHPARWPDREAAGRVADRLFEEYGRMPAGQVSRSEHRTGGVSLRAYRPSARVAGAAVLLVHGGGYAFGSIDERQNVAMAHARALGTGATVYAVRYRLAPEHPFPAAVEDVAAALRFVHSVADRIVVDGVSSGAGLAAAAVLRCAADGRPPPAGLVLEIPSLDLRPEAPWLAEFAETGGVADRDTVREYYLAGADPVDPRASPAAGDLAVLPPTHVITAELDPLRAAGEEFVRRLRAAGGCVTATRHLGAVHGSLNLTGASRDARLWEHEVHAAIREFIDSPPAGSRR